MKALARKLPFYKFLCRVKDSLTNYLLRTILGSYYPPRGKAKAWDGRPPFDKPEASLADLALLFPSYITTVLDVGCAAGRFFLPLNGKYRLWGIDIVPFERMKWLAPFETLTYEQKTLQQLTVELEQGKHDLTHTLVHTHAVLGLASGRWQRRFYAACKKSGCKNFYFEEYPYTPQYAPKENFKLPENEFVNKQWRPQTWMPIAHYRFESRG
jgi:SAM-dependent methyltransferase